MRKNILLIAMVAVLASGLLFAQATQEEPKKEGPIELTFWSLFTGGDGEYFDAMIQEFNASQDKIVMKNDMVKFDNYYTKLTTALAAKTAPDVVVIHQGNLLNYVPSGSLLALDGLVDSTTLADFQKAPLDGCRFDGKLYALPLDVHPIVMYYNKDLLAKAGITEIPQSAQDLINAGLAVKKATGKWGFAIDNTTGTYKAYTLTRLFMSMVAQQGGSLLTADDKAPNFDNAYGLKALKWLQELVNTYKINPTELDYDGAMNTFKLGDAAFYFNGVWATGTLEQQKGLNFGAAPLPAIMGGQAAWAGSHTFAIPTQKNQDPQKVKAAVTFIEWMTSHGELWAKAGHIPTRKSVAAKDSFKALPYRADYAASAAFALSTPRTPAWEEIYGTLSDKLEYAVTKNQDPAQALADMSKTTKDILASY
ncbi:ABC transporter substrate-binding protein [uncultured Sphaerochaeta sp.]|uniref:ABC transporter substrate-binding protein n=1 Tax=uncultured Sphaerochaeta sp. TaxID=886478 RepID=UPI002A0A9F73|nr:ABC transporter substrate-binding protein [uncultured Sphaerochaeta sp.]